ncbi:sulfite oxidase [Arthrobacter sp. ZBG10]|jgi:sulfane dehydrogenase subunit SoxC|uniref:sulfite oxidase n=1 Tax=unclassified Arthrobacter TaxID=235627 RepID=UPI00067FF87A|nr:MULTISPECIES: sulfite oxidase [unclassified Arthrobacter]KNH15464.1 sulfite oxidase [Arthrobacter sp. ZBG10]KQR00192.1 sulfite oxidase [Arthrobacter sp. Leaf141]
MAQIHDFQQSTQYPWPVGVPAPAGPTDGPLTPPELQLAARNHAMPLEALRRDFTAPGLHYVLTHFDIPDLDAATWHLQVGGAVERSLEISMAALRKEPGITVPVTLECAGNGRSLLAPRPVSQPWVLEAVGTANWTGVPLSHLLGKAGVLPQAVEVVFTGVDAGIQGGVPQKFARSLPIHEAMRPDVVLAYAMNGGDLPPQHGHPLRLVVPGWYGMASVKWLESIEVVTAPFAGYQQQDAYRYQDSADDAGTPVSRIRVRSLMVPPGVPDFFTRHRVVPRGQVLLEGRAWSGQGAVTGVEVGVDGQWMPAQLEKSLGGYAWRKWTVPWTADPGEHVLCCRATDDTGATQPLEQNWNYQGMGNNMVHRVSVRVD